jgi:hypothetical protein
MTSADLTNLLLAALVVLALLSLILGRRPL